MSQGKAEIEIAAGCRGISSWKVVNGRYKHVVLPVPEEFLNFYVPWPWQEQLLPCGAYTSLWPDDRGNDWRKVPPQGWDEDWRPGIYDGA